MQKINISFILNGSPVKICTGPNKRALDLLRDDLGMLSVKEGCAEGECGACTIIFNGAAVTSCCMLAGQLDGAEVVTLEGLAKDGHLDVVQQAFMEAGAVQCGYCTPGMILTARAFLDKNPDPTIDEIKEAMSGNLCRCTGYAKIVDAVGLAARLQKEQTEKGAGHEQKIFCPGQESR